MTANRIGTVEELELLDGTVVTLRALSISRQRKAMKMIGEDLEEESEDNPDPLTKRLLQVFAFVFKNDDAAAHLQEDYEALEDAVDMDTLKYVIKKAVGFDLDEMAKMMAAAMAAEASGQKTD